MKIYLRLGLVALAAGFALGLYFAWIVSPNRYIDTTPNLLRADFKDEFRSTIAAAYAATHNLERAKARMVLLGDSDPIRALTAQAQRMLAAGEPIDIIREVASLAGDLQTGVSKLPQSTPALSVTGQVSVTRAVISSPSPTTSETLAQPALAPTTTPSIVSTLLVFDTPAARPTRTPIPTTGLPYQLAGQDKVCNPNLTNGLMQVVVFDALHHPMPGVELIITYSDGEEHFFTGLKPELGDGYADYIMRSGVSYTLRAGQSGNLVPNLIAPACPDANGQTYIGGLKLTFQQQ